MQKFFDLSDEGVRCAYIEEAFVADVQFDICSMMKRKGVTRADLARLLRVSPPHVTQMLGDGDANLTLRTTARIYAALGEEAHVSAKSTLHRGAAAREKSARTKGTWLSVGIANDTWKVDEEPMAKDMSAPDTPSKCAVIWLDAHRRAA